MRAVFYSLEIGNVCEPGLLRGRLVALPIRAELGECVFTCRMASEHASHGTQLEVAAPHIREQPAALGVFVPCVDVNYSRLFGIGESRSLGVAKVFLEYNVGVVRERWTVRINDFSVPRERHVMPAAKGGIPPCRHYGDIGYWRRLALHRPAFLQQPVDFLVIEACLARLEPGKAIPDTVCVETVVGEGIKTKPRHLLHHLRSNPLSVDVQLPQPCGPDTPPCLLNRVAHPGVVLTPCLPQIGKLVYRKEEPAILAVVLRLIEVVRDGIVYESKELLRRMRQQHQIPALL